MKAYRGVAEYISSRPKEVRGNLKILRGIVKKLAPRAIETVKYGIPTYVGNKNLVHFGGYATHIALYPGPRAIKKFDKELLKYNCSKGTIRFPVGKSIPIGLIKKIVSFCVKEDSESVGKE